MGNKNQLYFFFTTRTNKEATGQVITWGNIANVLNIEEIDQWWPRYERCLFIAEVMKRSPTIFLTTISFELIHLWNSALMIRWNKTWPKNLVRCISLKMIINTLPICSLGTSYGMVKLGPLQWRHNGLDGVSNHQPRHCYSTVHSGANQRKHQSPISLAFVREIHRWPVNSPHKWRVTRKMFPSDDVIIRYLVHVITRHLFGSS